MRYVTFGTGKWHNGIESFARGFTDGAEIFFGGMADHWNVPCFHFGPSGRYDRRCLSAEVPSRSNKVSERACDHIHASRHSTDLISDAACAFLNRAPTDKPYLAYVSFLAPHDPRTMPRKLLDMYRPEDIPLPPNFMEGHPFDNGELRIRDEMLAAFFSPHARRNPSAPGGVLRHEQSSGRQDRPHDQDSRHIAPAGRPASSNQIRPAACRRHRLS